MFYNTQENYKKENYKKMLSIIGNLTRLFSDNSSPYLPYRVHENIFCKYFDAENLGRADCSADAKINNIGLGLKTWVGRNDQKIAEFGKLRHTYESMSGAELVKKISEYRNKRIRVTKKMYGLDVLIYHVIKRVPGSMQIIEYAFDEIDTENIRVDNSRGNNNNTYFSDGKNEYHFSISKNTLYRIFEEVDSIDFIEVEIMEDPFNYLMTNQEIPYMSELISGGTTEYNNVEMVIEEPSLGAFHSEDENRDLDKLCLRLYSSNSSGQKKVHKRSGLNQWNANGRRRHENEIYIPYPVKDRSRSRGFFPPRNTEFKLILPDGTELQAKVCQQDGKAIMSNPNKALGEWLLRKVLEIPVGELLTYEMLETFGIDSVIFTKLGNCEYSIDFSDIGTYEEYYESEVD